MVCATSVLWLLGSVVRRAVALTWSDYVTLSTLGLRFHICKMGITMLLCLPLRVVLRS